jgi:hypothetical protein
MRSHAMLGTLLLVGACGGAYYTTQTASPSAAPADVIACARSQLGGLKYQETSFDENENRVTARRTDDTIHRADPTYRRNIDRLEITAAPGADGKTSLSVVGHTFAEFETHRGPTEQEERASANVRQAAQSIIDACGHS